MSPQKLTRIGILIFVGLSLNSAASANLPISPPNGISTMLSSEPTQESLVQRFGGLYEHSAWIIVRAYSAGLPTDSTDPDVLSQAFRSVLAEATNEEKLGLIRAHPDLVGKAAIAGELTDESSVEQNSAGLNQCTEREFARFTELNSAYKQKFGFPFVMAVRESHRTQILAAFEERMNNAKDDEFERALDEINQIARLRLDALLENDSNAPSASV